MVVAGLVASLFTACNGSSLGYCKRALYWDDEWEPKVFYSSALRDTFDLDSEGQPHRGDSVFFRLNELEKYCYQMRAKD